MVFIRSCRVPCIVLLFIFIFAGCSPEKETGQDQIIARINNFQLTKEEFQKKLVNEIEYSEAYKTTADAKMEFLDSIIKKELLIQEAVKFGIDKKQDFTSAIEKYWEATLIKHLMEEKNREILKLVTVSEKEIQMKYNEIKLLKKGPPPLEEIEKQIAEEISETKKTALLNEWIDSLYKKAEIKINAKLINE